MDDNLILENPIEILNNTLLELAEKDERIVFVSADSSRGSGGIRLMKKYPERVFEFGIAEQNASAVAAGLAWAGKIPFWAGGVTFITMRCYEQIRNDIVRTKLHVIICGRGAGASWSDQGPTHVSIDDVGILRTLPKLTIVAPADGMDYRNAIIESTRLKGPVYIRIHGNLAPRVNPENYNFKIGKGVLLREGNDITFIGYGAMVYTLLKVSKILKRYKINSTVINMHTIKPIDEEIIIESAKKTKLVATLEEHSTYNGLGSAVADVLSQNYPVKLIKFGFDDEWPVDGGVWEEVMDYHGLSADKISRKIRNILS